MRATAAAARARSLVCRTIGAFFLSLSSSALVPVASCTRSLDAAGRGRGREVFPLHRPTEQVAPNLQEGRNALV